MPDVVFLFRMGGHGGRHPVLATDRRQQTRMDCGGTPGPGWRRSGVPGIAAALLEPARLCPRCLCRQSQVDEPRAGWQRNAARLLEGTASWAVWEDVPGVHVRFGRNHAATRSLRHSQKSSKRPLSFEQRRAMMAFAPLTVQCIPARLRRVPITTLHLASRTPVEVQNPCA